MHADSQMPNESQQRAFGNLLSHALVRIRSLAASGQTQQAFDLADAFHNVPRDVWHNYFSISFFREAFLQHYVQKWSDGEHFVTMLDEIEKMK